MRRASGLCATASGRAIARGHRKLDGSRERLRPGPTIYEINTAAWLQRLGVKYGRPFGLGDVPDSEWDALAALPVDAVWLMGVWQRSPIGRTIALDEPQLLAGFRAALPGPARRGCAGLAVLRARLRRRRALRRTRRPGGGAQQLAHRDVARSSITCQTTSQPTIRGSQIARSVSLPAARRARAPSRRRSCEIAGGVFAKGRDPYFEPWQDVLQLNAFSPELREAAARSLSSSVRRCAFEFSERR